MMWCKMWANHTYRTKVCFQNRKPPCPLRQLSNKKQQIQWEVMYFSRLQPNTWKKKRWPNRQVFRKIFPLAVKVRKDAVLLNENLQQTLLILHPNELKRSRHPSAIWVQCMLGFSGFHLQKKRNIIWESSEVGFQSWHRLEPNILPIRPFLMCFSDKNEWFRPLVNPCEPEGFTCKLQECITVFVEFRTAGNLLNYNQSWICWK